MPKETNSRLSNSLKIVVSEYREQILQDKWRAGLGMLLPGIGNILVFYVPPLIIAKLLVRFNDSTANIEPADTLPYILAFAGFWAAGEIIWRIAIHHLIIFETRSMRRLYIQSMNYLLQKDQNFFNDNFVGSLTKKSIAYAKNFEHVLDTLSFSVISNIIPLFFITYVLWQFSPYLVLALFGILGLALVAVFPLIKRRQKLVDKREAASNVLSGNIADAITNMSAIHSFARETEEKLRHRRYVEDYIDKAKKSWDYQNLYIDALVASPTYVLVNLAGLVLAILIGKNNSASLEAIFVTFTYFAGFTRVIWEFNKIYRTLETNITEAAQFTELLLDEPKIKDPINPEPSRISRGKIEFKDVVFDYESSANNASLLNNFNLRIQPGEKVGLVGRSGGGKTTITKLLLRFMDVQDGAILIDGQDIRNISQPDLRSSIAYVAQEPLLFHRSINENIGYGNPEASEREIIETAKQAHAHEFTQSLEKGYETLVGERGVKLSGGQRQRIAIARAMLKNSPILLLDEATSALDSESEKYIQEALWRLMGGLTHIVIAHRLSTIQKMDRIIVIENGNIVEQGSHKELLRLNGTYGRLWEHQSDGFLEE